MQCVPQLRQFVLQLAHKFAFDLEQCGAYLRLDLRDADHYLVVENLGACRVSLARYLKSGPSRVADPEIILYTAYRNDEKSFAQAEWAPIERLQRFGGWAIYADIDSLGRLVSILDAQGQQDVAEFVETSFVKELQSQDWLTQGCRSTALKPYLTPEEQWLRGITFAYNDEPADPTTSRLMQKVVLRLAADYDVDLSQVGLQLVLSLPHRPEQLILMNLGDDRISVTRCVVEEAGQIAPDPDLIFHVNDTGGWQPEELLYSPEVWTEYVTVVGEAAAYAPDGEVNFVSFTEYWAQRLVDAGWLTQSQKLFQFSRMVSVETMPLEPFPIQGVSVMDDGSVQIACDCPEFGSECGAWLELSADGILAVEDKDGLRVSLILPAWLEQAMRLAVQRQWTFARSPHQPEIDVNYREYDVPF